MIPLAKILVVMVTLLFLSCFPGQTFAEVRQGIAVWDLEDVSPGGYSNFGEILTSQLSDILARCSTYSLVERSRLQRVLEEQKIGSTRLADPDFALRLGKMTGARLMVFGSYLIIGPVLRVDIRVVDVETSKVLKAFKKEGQSSDLNGAMEVIKGIGGDLVAYLDSCHRSDRLHYE